jgi:CDP-diacylglycerol pyrophosphatase
MHYETNDQNSDHQFMNSNINVNDYINKPYIGTDYNNRQDKGSTSNNQSIHISCSQTQPNVKYPGASHGKCNRRPNMQLSLNCSQYQQQRLRKNQQQEQQQQQQQQYDIIHTHTNNYESLNSNDLGSSSISENSNLLVGDMTWLSVCNFSNIDNSLFQEFVPWPVFDGPKPNCGQKQDDISRIYHTF